MEEQKLYRIVNKESGRPQMVGIKFYEDDQLLSQMGFIRQDVDPPKKKEVKAIEKEVLIVEAPIEQFDPLKDQFNPPHIGQAIPEKGKAGRPKKQ